MPAERSGGVSDGQYRFLKWTAIACAVFVGAALLYEQFSDRYPGLTDFQEAERFFEDGHYQQALAKYEAALRASPEDFDYQRGKARTLMQLERYEQAERLYDAVIEQRPDFGAAFANRGILRDRTGRYAEAIADYERALALSPELDEGPGWMTRFLRLQPEKPPTIAERAAYLRAELAKPMDQRVLRVPELDAAQRSYKQ